MPEVADSREDDFFGFCNVRWGADPGDFVAALFDSVDKTADVARDVVEEVDCWHGDRRIAGVGCLRRLYGEILDGRDQGSGIMIKAFYLLSIAKA